MIKKLDIEVSTRIAAGEVIERPSSVAKELIENSIDASASKIIIYVEQGGKTSFVIEDNGIGIASDELPLALERYATSKIESLEDLENISTLGYRGEALSSIATVSYLEIRSRLLDSENGGLIRSEGGKIVLHTISPCKPGTRIQVDDLFFNLPARRKFLKTASAELRRIIQIVNDYALIHPDITFILFSDTKKILEHLPAKNIAAALERRWGKDTKLYCSEFAIDMTKARLWWNPIPDSRRVIISLFVNGRRVQDSTVRAAICGGDSTAYGEWLILIDLPPQQVDVNIHPTKEEVRFRRSQDIFRVVYANAQKIFAERFSIQPTNRYNNQPHLSDFNLNLENSTGDNYQNSSLFTTKKWSAIDSSLEQRSASPIETIFTPGESATEMYNMLDKSFIGHTARGFLLFDFPGGLAVIDPHAAHERILFEDIKKSFSESILTQRLTIPHEIPEAILPEIKINKKELLSLGFEVLNNKLIGVPMIRGKGHLAPIEMLRSTLKGLEIETTPEKRDMEVWWRIARLACRDAVKLGQEMSKEEAMELLLRLEKTETPYSCPHGRPTMFILDNKKLEEWFER